jgi:hypothetical protein
MTTRQLEEPKRYDAPPRYDAPTQLTNSAPTSPAYMPPDAVPPQWVQPPDAMSPQWVQPTAGMQSGGQKKTVILLASVIGVLLITLAALLFVVMRNNTHPSQTPPRAGFPPPGVPPVPGGEPSGIPGGIPMPPTPPVPRGIPGSAPTTLAKDLIYPGATVTMSVPSNEGKAVTTLTVRDSFDKVVDWYLARVKPTKQVMLPGPTATLKGNHIAVVITAASDEISIIIAQGNEQ